MPGEVTNAIACSEINSCLDYSNAVLSAMSEWIITKRQRVQNTLLHGQRRHFEHIALTSVEGASLVTSSTSSNFQDSISGIPSIKTMVNSPTFTGYHAVQHRLTFKSAVLVYILDKKMLNLTNLHWLPVQHHLTFKTAFLVYPQ